MEIVALVDDYVFGFVLRASLAAFEEAREEEAEPGWMQAVFDYMCAPSSRPAPTPTCSASRTANRAAGGRDEDLARWPLDRAGASNAASSAPRRHRGASSSGVVEDDAERRALPGADRRHAVAHGRAVVAARAEYRPVARREDQERAALEVDDVRA